MNDRLDQKVAVLYYGVSSIDRKKVMETKWYLKNTDRCHHFAAADKPYFTISKKNG